MYRKSNEFRLKPSDTVKISEDVGLERCHRSDRHDTTLPFSLVFLLRCGQHLLSQRFTDFLYNLLVSEEKLNGGVSLASVQFHCVDSIDFF
jgi:hypothetical protein